MHHYFPRLVELHNYSAAHSTAQKQYNWTTLNQKARVRHAEPAATVALPPRFTPAPPVHTRMQVFRRLGFALAREQCEAVASAEPGAIERVLKLARARMARFQEGGSRAGTGGADTSGSASSSQPGSPVCAAAVESPPVAAADSIAALRLAAEVPAKLGGAQPYAAALATTSAPFGTPDQALAASLADKEAQLAELRETNEVGGGQAEAGRTSSSAQCACLSPLPSLAQILETKVRKLEQLVRLKDAKIQVGCCSWCGNDVLAAGGGRGGQRQDVRLISALLLPTAGPAGQAAGGTRSVAERIRANGMIKDECKAAKQQTIILPVPPPVLPVFARPSQCPATATACAGSLSSTQSAFCQLSADVCQSI